jgi:hypothetical protein
MTRIAIQLGMSGEEEELLRLFTIILYEEELSYAKGAACRFAYTLQRYRGQ